MKKRAVVSLLLLLVIALSSGCVGFAQDIRLSSLAQKKRHHEIIGLLQPEVDRHATLSSFQLMLLSGAYYEIRDYENMLKATDLMDRQIAGGDTGIYGGSLSVYPRLFRSYVYVDQGDYARAVKVLNEAMAILNGPDGKGNGFYHSQLIDITRLLGVAHAHLNNDAQAERCVRTLSSLDTKVLGPVLAPEKFIAIATVQMARKQYRQALAAIRNSEAKASGPTTVFYDATFQELPRFFIETKCLYETGELREAREGYDRLLKHSQIREVGGLYWPVLLDRAKIARAEGQDKAAEGFLREAVDVVEKQRASITSEAGRIGYVGDKQAVYQELITLLVAENRPEDAFEYVERAKGRALVDLLASQKDIAPRNGNAGDITTKFNALAKGEKELSIVADPDSRPDADRTRGVVVTLKKEIASRAPEFTSLVAVTGTPVQEIRDRLAGDETLVEYYASDRDWFVFVLKHSGITVRKLGALDLDQDVRKFRTALTNPVSDEYAGYSRDLYRKLVAPIADQLTSSRLTIVPHGPLHYLPFGALSSGKEYLVDRATIRVLQTASILKFLKNGTTKGNPSILVVGNPNLGDAKYDLKYAQEEAQAIAALMPGATLLLRDDAKASFVSRTAGHYTIIHFAAHAVFDPDNPLESALLLAKDGSSDGWLRAGTLYNLNLHADLVTLSACETALGKITQGDDVIGFTRGLLYAGAGTIVSTLWRVDDRATKDLMLDFYAKLLKMEKGEALRQAQLDVKKKYPHPFYWASFQLTGNTK